MQCVLYFIALQYSVQRCSVVYVVLLQRSVFDSAMLCRVVFALCCVVLYYLILSCSVLWCLCCVALHCNVLCGIASNCIALYRAALSGLVLF